MAIHRSYLLPPLLDDHAHAALCRYASQATHQHVALLEYSSSSDDHIEDEHNSDIVCLDGPPTPPQHTFTNSVCAEPRALTMALTLPAARPKLLEPPPSQPKSIVLIDLTMDERDAPTDPQSTVPMDLTIDKTVAPTHPLPIDQTINEPVAPTHPLQDPVMEALFNEQFILQDNQRGQLDINIQPPPEPAEVDWAALQQAMDAQAGSEPEPLTAQTATFGTAQQTTDDEFMTNLNMYRYDTQPTPEAAMGAAFNNGSIQPSTDYSLAGAFGAGSSVQGMATAVPPLSEMVCAQMTRAVRI
ncbi:hypothetical protein CALVIDRAFT_240194 [Calocera viscosa TUFC12733]|uniref:Uncharacterized protein n=1 Tax=Calocera viscosa (strain TUFC12733) TaxID=1330018 RepID=A0A167JN14_CALVF|nr:hypothetical protein CALVIDRAFT_240194 [Calocera viscosa TUFC12733]